jgi:hypothetical protein
MAHEIGHLLLGLEGHTDSGIMEAELDPGTDAVSSPEGLLPPADCQCAVRFLKGSSFAGCRRTYSPVEFGSSRRVFSKRKSTSCSSRMSIWDRMITGGVDPQSTCYLAPRQWRSASISVLCPELHCVTCPWLEPIINKEPAGLVVGGTPWPQ